METETTSDINKSIQLLPNTIQRLTVSRESDLSVALSDLNDCRNEFDGDDIRLLTHLISQLESIKESCVVKQSKTPAEPETEKDQSSPIAIRAETKSKAMDTTDGAAGEEIVEELRNLRKQNTTTHWLLSGLIFLTVAWKLSEVSIVLILRNRLKNPLGLLKRITKAKLRGVTAKNQDSEKQELPSSTITAPSIESMTMRLQLMNMSQTDLELLRMQLQGLVYGDDK